MPFFDRVPRHPKTNLKFRRWLLQRADASRRVRHLLLEACKMDPLFWVSAFGWQHNPKPTGLYSTEVGPFVCWPYQDRALTVILEAIRGQNDLVIEKSRDMGASWLSLFAVTHQAFFLENKAFLMMSKDDPAVDKAGSSNSLFWKIDWILNHLPPWMTDGKISPPGERRDAKFRTEKMFQFPGTNSMIEGAASTKTVGVGGRATAIFVDEFAKIKDDWEIMTFTAATSRCRIFNSTHMGLDRAFYKLTRDARVKKLRMHWSEHPDKIHGLYTSNYETHFVEILDKGFQYPKDFKFIGDGKLRSPWYDLECVRMGENKKGIATELDINPGGSVEQFFEAGLIEMLVRRDCRPPLFVGDVDYDAETGRFIAFVPNPKGRLRLWRPPVGMGGLVASNYGIGCDNALGAGSTPTCASMLDLRTGEKVGEFVDAHIKPEAFGPLLIALGWSCRTEAAPDGTGSQPAWLGWEGVGPGAIMWSKIKDFGYPRLFYANKKADEAGEIALRDVPGFTPNDDSSLKLLSDYRDCLSRGTFVNPSEEALMETLMFRMNLRGYVEHSRIKSKENLGGSGVSHADIAEADALACMLMLKYGDRIEIKEAKIVHESSLAYRRQMHELRQREKELWI